MGVDDFGLDGYSDFELIGRGGYSQVYRAHEEATDRDVAIKLLDVDEFDGAARVRFERECHATGRLSHHPNIVTLYNAGVSAHGRPFIVMEFYSRGSLAQELKRDGPLSVRRCLHVGVRLAGALETAHQQGVLHRDIKPENVLVATFGDEPALADFGIATFAIGVASRTGTSITPVHAPTEVVQGERASVRSDIYSLGSTLYALLAGRGAFAGESGESIAPILYRIVHEPVPPIERSDLPPELFAVLESSMAKDPNARPGSAADLGRQLQAVQDEMALPVTELTTRSVDTPAPTQVDAPPPEPGSRLVGRTTQPPRQKQVENVTRLRDVAEPPEQKDSEEPRRWTVPLGAIAGLVGLVLIFGALWIVRNRDDDPEAVSVDLPDPVEVTESPPTTTPTVPFDELEPTPAMNVEEVGDGAIRLSWVKPDSEEADLFLLWTNREADGEWGGYDPRAAEGERFADPSLFETGMELGDREALTVSGLDYGQVTCFRFLLVQKDVEASDARHRCVPTSPPGDPEPVGTNATWAAIAPGEEVFLAWDYDSRNEAGFVVLRGEATEPANGTLARSTGLEERQVLLPGLALGECYGVFAYNAAGRSEDGTGVCALQEAAG